MLLLRAASAQSFTLWQRATIETASRAHSIRSANPARGASRFQRYADQALATVSNTTNLLLRNLSSLGINHNLLH